MFQENFPTTIRHRHPRTPPARVAAELARRTDPRKDVLDRLVRRAYGLIYEQ